MVYKIVKNYWKIRYNGSREKWGLFMKWKALAFEAEIISKDILSKEFLTEELYRAYRDQTIRLKKRLENLSELENSNALGHLQEKFALIEARLNVLNPTHRIQTNFEFFTRKITHCNDRLSFLKESLLLFECEYENLSTVHCKKVEIEKEIALLERQLLDAMNQREALLA